MPGYILCPARFSYPWMTIEGAAMKMYGNGLMATVQVWYVVSFIITATLRKKAVSSEYYPEGHSKKGIIDRRPAGWCRMFFPITSTLKADVERPQVVLDTILDSIRSNPPTMPLFAARRSWILRSAGSRPGQRAQTFGVQHVTQGPRRPAYGFRRKKTMEGVSYCGFQKLNVEQTDIAGPLGGLFSRNRERYSRGHRKNGWQAEAKVTIRCRVQTLKSRIPTWKWHRMNRMISIFRHGRR